MFGTREGKKSLVEEVEHPMRNRVANVVRERREQVVVPKPIEVFDNLDDDLDRIELWTTALSCFQHPAPEH